MVPICTSSFHCEMRQHIDGELMGARQLTAKTKSRSQRLAFELGHHTEIPMIKYLTSYKEVSGMET